MGRAETRGDAGEDARRTFRPGMGTPRGLSWRSVGVDGRSERNDGDACRSGDLSGAGGAVRDGAPGPGVSRGAHPSGFPACARGYPPAPSPLRRTWCRTGSPEAPSPACWCPSRRRVVDARSPRVRECRGAGSDPLASRRVREPLAVARPGVRVSRSLEIERTSPRNRMWWSERGVVCGASPGL